MDLSFSAEVKNKREGKMSEKKSDLYLKIMRDHNKHKDKSPVKLSYEIPSLIQPTTTTKEYTGLTIQKPFEFQTSKRARLDTEELPTNYEPMCL